MRRAAVIALALVAAASACNALTSVSDYREVDCTDPCIELDTGLDATFDAPPTDTAQTDTTPSGDVADATDADGAHDTGPADALADADADAVRETAIDPSPYDPCGVGGHILCDDFEPSDAAAQFKLCTDPGITPGVAVIDPSGDEYASAVSSLSAATAPDTTDFQEACFVGHVASVTAHRFDLDLAVYIDAWSPSAALGHASIATIAFDTANVSLDLDHSGYWAVTTKYGTTSAAAHISPKLVETHRWHEVHVSVDWNASPFEVDLTVDHAVVGTFFVGLGAFPSTLDVRVGVVTTPPWDQTTKVHVDNVYFDDSP